jgi:hypothetical protein
MTLHTFTTQASVLTIPSHPEGLHVPPFLPGSPPRGASCLVFHEGRQNLVLGHQITWGVTWEGAGCRPRYPVLPSSSTLLISSGRPQTLVG